MNWFSVAIAIFLLLSALWSAKRGFLRSLIGTISLILLIIGTIMLTQPVREVMSGSESVHDFTHSRAEHFLDARIEEMEESGELPSWIMGLPLPEETKAMLGDGDATLTVALLKTDVVRSVIITQIANVILQGITILIAFIAAFLLIVILRVLIGLFVKLPVVKTVDRVLGFFFGLAKAVLVIWICFALIRFVSQLLPLPVVPMIEDSLFLQFFYEWNPIYHFIEAA